MHCSPVVSSAHESPFGIHTPHSTLRAIIDTARQRYGRVSVGIDEFSAHLRRPCYAGALPSNGEALYLCLACSLGDQEACNALERVHLSNLRPFLADLRLSESLVDDVRQEMLHRLLVGHNPKVLTYQGRGPFEVWLRRIARRAAIDLLRRQRREGSQRATAKHHMHTCSESPEEIAAREASVRVVFAALNESLQSLEGSERELLRNHFVQGLSIDVLARRFSIDRSTAARRITRTVRRVRSGVEREVLRQTGRIYAPEVAAVGSSLSLYCDVDVDRMLDAE
jgi:RNA polymerase sigma-70 factor, ECF subfamily